MPFELTHPDKVMFPKDGYTKGDLFRYYARIASQILPVIRDRPLALKRYPDGIDASHFFQQKAPLAGNRPGGVRVERVPVVAEGGSLNERIVGGTLATLLYTVQLGCIRGRSLARPRAVARGTGLLGHRSRSCTKVAV